MQWLWELVSNPYLLTPLFSWFIAQVIKTIIYAAINKKIEWERMYGDGGMPSCHSATVTSLSALCLYINGPGSVEFAITLILSVVVCHDATGVRRETGKQAILINEIIEILESQELPEIKLKELVGHTPLQVFAGAIIGIVNATILYFSFWH